MDRCIGCRRLTSGSEPATRPPAGSVPDAKLELVEGVGHHIELEAPEQVTVLIRELANRAA
jgi:hypothetical protein